MLVDGAGRHLAADAGLQPDSDHLYIVASVTTDSKFRTASPGADSSTATSASNKKLMAQRQTNTPSRSIVVDLYINIQCLYTSRGCTGACQWRSAPFNGKSRADVQITAVHLYIFVAAVVTA